MEELFFGVNSMLERERSGLYKHSGLAEQIESLALLIQEPGVSEWWNSWKNIFGHELVTAIESRSEVEKLFSNSR
jgi:hypothetical protein